MKINNFLSVIFFIWFASSCNQSLKVDSRSSINLKNNATLSIFDVFQEVDIIPLETSDKSRIGDIFRVVAFSDKLLIHDYANRKVFCFSNDGSFLFEVGRAGRAEGEFLTVTDVAFDYSNKNILLLDAPSHRVLVFSINGEYEKSIEIKLARSLGLNRIIPLKNRRLLLYDFAQNEYLVYSLDQEMIVSNFGGTLGPQRFFPSLNSIYSFWDNVFFYPPFESTIWKLGDEGWEIHKKLDFGKHNNTPNAIKKVFDQIPEWEGENRRIMPNFFTGKGRLLSHHLIQAFETERYLVLNIEFQNEPKNVLIDKIDGKQKVFNSFSENLCFPLHAHKQSNSLILVGRAGSIKPSDGFLKMYPKDAEDIIAFYNRNHTFFTRDILTERGKEVYDNHDSMHDNPYLVIFKFKE